MTTITCTRETALPVADFRRVLVESGLGATRPVDDAVRLQAMLAGANFVLAARDGGEVVGVARCVTDFSWCCYVAELAVSRSCQGRGVGRSLLEAARRELGPTVSVVLSSMPDAVGFYEAAGMSRVGAAFYFPRER